MAKLLFGMKQSLDDEVDHDAFGPGPILFRREGEIAVGGPALAAGLSRTGLIDEYRLYLHPVAPGAGNPFFQGPRPRLRPTSRELIEDMVLLTYVPA